MIGYIIAGYLILPTAFNLIVVVHKRKKTKKVCIKKLEEKGYIVDDRFKKLLITKIVGFICKKYDIEYAYSDYATDLSNFSWVPVLRWYGVYSNIKYLNGGYEFNEFYAAIEDSIEDEKIIENLKECELIKEDKEKMQFLKDRDDAPEELMDKYDEINSEKSSKNVQESSEDIVFSKKDSLTELNQKLVQLQQLINEKENEDAKDNKDIKSYTYESKKE